MMPAAFGASSCIGIPVPAQPPRGRRYPSPIACSSFNRYRRRELTRGTRTTVMTGTPCLMSGCERSSLTNRAQRRSGHELWNGVLFVPPGPEKPIVKLVVEVPLDDEGFLALQCPTCGGRFKLTAAVFEEHAWQYLTCALCGIARGRSLFHPPDVMRAAVAKVQASIIGKFDRMMGGLERATRGQLVSFKRVRRTPVRIPRLRAVTDLVVTDLRCCRDKVKLPLASAVALFYCPLCGQAQD